MVLFSSGIGFPAVVHEWSSNCLDCIKPSICSYPYSWNGRVCFSRRLQMLKSSVTDDNRSFIGWYYYVAPSHPVFAIVRRTLTLTNFIAFTIFIAYPCMPPRLLPPEYGFLDSVRHDDAQSVWMGGKYVNALAAMPSMHFGYSFCIGCTLIYHSGVFRRDLHQGEKRKSTFWRIFYVLLGALYPTVVLITIIATANHYWLDAIAATGCVVIGFLFNRIFLIFLPLEDLLLWTLRLEKPTPSTRDKYSR
jgi:hypothetical protein